VSLVIAVFLPSISLLEFMDVSQLVTYFFGLLNSVMNNRYAYFIASFKNCWHMLKDRSSYSSNVQGQRAPSPRDTPAHNGAAQEIRPNEHSSFRTTRVLTLDDDHIDRNM
jgi:hypothetical protein